MKPAEFKRTREKLGLTQAQLGWELDIDAGTVSKLERGELRMRKLYAWAIRGLVAGESHAKAK